MEIVSPSFEDGGELPVLYTCDGENIHPRLEFENLPVGTKSIALVIEDPDNNGEIFTHWTIWNIPAESPFIEEDMLPEGVVEGQTSFGECGYHGPCPKTGNHRYLFRAYALDDFLELPVNSPREEFDEEITKHLLLMSEISVFYPQAYAFESEEGV